jgi:hypothetical protein
MAGFRVAMVVEYACLRFRYEANPQFTYTPLLHYLLPSILHTSFAIQSLLQNSPSDSPSSPSS